MDYDKPIDECGVFGIYNYPDVVEVAHFALYSLQHRGEESAGIATATSNKVMLLKSMGLVDDFFKSEGVNDLKGRSAIGHVRYSLVGDSVVANAQPFAMDMGFNPDQTSNGERVRYGESFFQTYRDDPIAVAHNGEFHDLEELCKGGSDTKQFACQLSRSDAEGKKKAILDLLRNTHGSYGLVMLTPDMLVGARDPEGYRPLSLGFLDGAVMLASESCAFKSVGGVFDRDLNPGEVLFIDKKGMHSEYILGVQLAMRNECIFEFIYLARPDSTIFGKSVRKFRLQAGRKLATEHPVKADIVLAVPDAGNLYGIGYANVLGILYEPEGLKRNHYYPGRIFIQPDHEKRIADTALKFFVVEEAVKGKVVVLVDDSIVRGVNTQAAASLLRRAGAKEIHVRIASPPYITSCRWGVGTYDTSLLIAHKDTKPQMLSELGVDSLEYLSLDGLLSIFPNPEHKCVKCFKE